MPRRQESRCPITAVDHRGPQPQKNGIPAPQRPNRLVREQQEDGGRELARAQAARIRPTLASFDWAIRWSNQLAASRAPTRAPSPPTARIAASG